ncbi:antibiotic biosynthesis monooxygenase [Solidesulfovibrio fructosivorans JJ]]|uniref:Antibiotic biosynthesis monooxygenase n=1 Tax=Solidesulfovibrio fructosivorans JJ] TaxID=596151 RepID=E1JU60_SOLFR|nr:antibiotic biosynthesis monooxygenase [Solidesulfovibrio fructosivorans]EFL51990.1 antibiotic biosynthesis monooxygenase [Solidesulfovibrio fructosivorans JJ]]
MIAHTPTPPYYAVIFTSIRTEGDNGYAAMADRMLALAAGQPGYLGVESARDAVGITVSYWSDLESITRWKQNLHHQNAQRLGREKWYTAFQTRVVKVERDSGMKEPESGT